MHPHPTWQEVKLHLNSEGVLTPRLMSRIAMNSALVRTLGGVAMLLGMRCTYYAKSTCLFDYRSSVRKMTEQVWKFY